MRDGEPPSVASRSRCGRRGGVDTDEGAAESIKLKPKKINDVEDKVVEVFFSELSEQ
jgi:hypothetical protein